MRCPRCNRIILNTLNFCPYCGEKNLRSKAEKTEKKDIKGDESALVEEDNDSDDSEDSLGKTQVVEIRPEFFNDEEFKFSDETNENKSEKKEGKQEKMKTLMGLGFDSPQEEVKEKAHEHQKVDRDSKASFAKKGQKEDKRGTKESKKTVIGIGIEDIDLGRKESAEKEDIQPEAKKGGIRKTIKGIGVENILSNPETKSNAKKTVIGLGLDEVIPDIPDVKSHDSGKKGVKKTVAGIGIENLIPEKEEAGVATKSKKTIIGSGLDNIIPVDAVKKTKDKKQLKKSKDDVKIKDKKKELKEKEINKEDNLENLIPKVPLEDSEYFEESTVSEPVSTENFIVEELEIELLDRMPDFTEDIESLNYMPPPNNFVGMFTFGGYVKRFLEIINENRKILKKRREILIQKKKEILQEIGKISWLKGIRIAGLDSYYSQLAFFKEKVVQLENRINEIKEEVIGKYKVEQLENYKIKIRYLKTELSKEKLHLKEQSLVEKRIKNLSAEIKYLENILSKTKKLSQKQTINNLIEEKKRLLDETNKKKEKIFALLKDDKNRKLLFEKELKKLIKKYDVLNMDIKNKTYKFEEEISGIVKKHSKLLESIGEIILASQSMKKGPHKELKPHFQLIQFIDEWIEKENVYYMKLKELEKRIDKKRVKQTKVFKVSFILLILVIIGFGSFLILYLMDLI